MPPSKSSSGARSSPSAAYDSYASTYDALDDDTRVTNLLGIEKGRRNLLSQCRGSVLEIGCGTGINLKYYDFAKVSSLTMLDSSEGMIDVARGKAESDDVPKDARGRVKFVVGDATKKSDMIDNFGPSSFDFVVDTFTLCVLDDRAVDALRRMKELLKPNGRVVLFENSRSSSSILGAYQDLTSRAAASAGGKGCVYNQRVDALIRQAGMNIVQEGSFAGGTLRTFVCGLGEK